jgi:hypothetical protein
MVTTDETGFALFDVEYAREFTWVEIQLEARVTVAGSEGASTATFFLPGLADDFNDCDVSPPGQVSPYGVATTCSCDEAADPTDPTCPIRTFLGPVLVQADNPIVSGAGGVVTFTVEGGAERTYLIEATDGTLSTQRITFGETFTLTVPASLGFTEILVTVIDEVTLQTTIVTVTQEASSFVTITPVSPDMPAAGDVVTFDVAGGTETTYTVNATGSCTLDLATPPTLTFGEPFDLICPPNTTGSTRVITVTVIDDLIPSEVATATVTQPSLSPITITPASTVVAAAGGTVILTPQGGTQTIYEVVAAVNEGDTLQTGMVNFGTPFILTVPANATSRTITVTFTDQLSGQVGTAVVTQQ